MKWDQIETATPEELDGLPVVKGELSKTSSSKTDLSGDCPKCGTLGAYVSTGEHPETGEDIVHCSKCNEVFKITW
jgi:hypothetical protein